MKYVLFLAVLLFIPIATALPCSDTAHPLLCEEVMSSFATQEEKHWLVTELMQDRRDFPNHEFVYDWNTAVDTFVPPDGVEMKSNGFIKDVWLKLLAVMPSVLENETLYINDTGALLSAYNHRIEIPPDYTSPGYPSTRNGDCATYYHVVEHSPRYDAFMNYAHLGTEHLVNYTAELKSKFKGVYDVLLRTDIDHWKWRRYCCGRNGHGRCIKYCATCEFRNTEHKVDQVTVKDELKAEQYRINMSAEFRIIDNQTHSVKGVLESDNFSSIQLSFVDSNYSEYHDIYTLNRSIPPHDILTVKTEKVERKNAKNLNIRGNKTHTVVLKNPENCSISLSSYFSSVVIPCNLTDPGKDPFITTDKTSYDQNETIIVKIEPEGDYNISYAGENYTATSEIRLKAAYPHNRISLFVKGKEISKIIHVKESESWNFLFGISLFGGMNYLLVEVLRKLWGALL